MEETCLGHYVSEVIVERGRPYLLTRRRPLSAAHPIHKSLVDHRTWVLSHVSHPPVGDLERKSDHFSWDRAGQGRVTKHPSLCLQCWYTCDWYSLSLTNSPADRKQSPRSLGKYQFKISSSLFSLKNEEI